MDPHAHRAGADLAPTIDCRSIIDAVDELPPDYHVVLDAVALAGSDAAHRALQANPDTPEPREARWFTKTGLLVRTGAPARLVVPEQLRDSMSLRWGSSPRTWDLSVPSCEGRDLERVRLRIQREGARLHLAPGGGGDQAQLVRIGVRRPGFVRGQLHAVKADFRDDSPTFRSMQHRSGTGTGSRVLGT